MYLKFGKRKLQQVRYSFSVNLPPEWIKTHDIRKGDLLEMSMNEKQELVLAPATADEASAGTSLTA